jgi:hypothetical protein
MGVERRDILKTGLHAPRILKRKNRRTRREEKNL